jgi:hypothetical protein
MQPLKTVEAIGDTQSLSGEAEDFLLIGGERVW